MTTLARKRGGNHALMEKLWSQFEVSASVSISLFIVMLFLFVQNFTERQSGMSDHLHLFLGELSRIVYCLLQKTKLSSSLPVFEKWEASMLPYRSCFAPIDEEHFLERTRLLAALAKVNSVYPKKSFRMNCRQILSEIFSTIFRTMAARSLVRQSLSCFLLEKDVAGEVYSAFYFFWELVGEIVNSR